MGGALDAGRDRMLLLFLPHPCVVHPYTQHRLSWLASWHQWLLEVFSTAVEFPIDTLMRLGLGPILSPPSSPFPSHESDPALSLRWPPHLDCHQAAAGYIPNRCGMHQCRCCMAPAAAVGLLALQLGHVRHHQLLTSFQLVHVDT